MLPGIFGSSVAQVSLLIDTQIASFLIPGSVSWLYFADRLMEFPLGVFSIALATVILPSLSRHHAAESMEHFTGTLDWALRLVIVLVSPAAVAMLVFAGPLTATTFGYGKFDAHDVQMASYALMAYSWGLLGFSLVKVLAPGYFARQDTKTPVRVGLIALGCNMALNMLRRAAGNLLRLAVSARPDRDLDLRLRRDQHDAAVARPAKAGVYQPRPGWGALLARVLFANAAMARAADLDGRRPRGLAGGIAARERAARLAMCIVAAAATYFAVLLLAGMRLRHIRNVAGASMEFIRGLQGLKPDHRGAAITVGSFDGIHLGHGALIARACALAKQAGEPAMMLTFEPLPREYLCTPPPGSAGAAHGFSRALARARAFGPHCRVRAALRREAAAADRRAVREPAGGALRRLGGGGRAGFSLRARRRGQRGAAAGRGRRRRFALELVPSVCVDDVRVSSSGVRAALARGDFRAARDLLGRAYSMRGRVVVGRAARPPAGISDREHPDAPAQAAVHRHLRGARARRRAVNPHARTRVASLGFRPTVGGTEPLLEAHVFDFDGLALRTRARSGVRREDPRRGEVREPRRAGAADAPGRGGARGCSVRS